MICKMLFLVQKLTLFADDTNLLLYNFDLMILKKNANQCLKSMEKWFTAKKLSVNSDKTCYTLLTSKPNQMGKFH